MTKGHLEKGWQKIYAKGPVTTLLYFQLNWITTKDDHDFSWSICEQRDTYLKKKKITLPVLFQLKRIISATF